MARHSVSQEWVGSRNIILVDLNINIIFYMFLSIQFLIAGIFLSFRDREIGKLCINLLDLTQTSGKVSFMVIWIILFWMLEIYFWFTTTITIILCLLGPSKAGAPAGRTRRAWAFDELRSYQHKTSRYTWGLKKIFWKNASLGPKTILRFFLQFSLQYLVKEITKND